MIYNYKIYMRIFLWLLLLLLIFINQYSYGEAPDWAWASVPDSAMEPEDNFCEDWIKLNTNVPFVGRCIEKVDDEAEEGSDWETTKTTTENAFAKLMWWLSKMVIAIIVVVSFLLLVAWWVMIAMAWANESLKSKWKDLVIRVIVGIVLLWASWIILHIINPNFFT